ncbi:chalcone isomerase family protein [Psychroflexus planctonicus]|uniref:Chalcone isomerase n=1 Tax=Psychroflexus planctonicus TaxID=1526575 RepID=A0ABQ1SJR1_9FLAO|nr:chalcone isomerase family protein [Psychroflexus planctonicus]GGE43458.1 chalcone isomerase [Psychroflexus planctonicus]
MILYNFEKTILFIGIFFSLSFVNQATAQIELSGTEIPSYLEINSKDTLQLFGAGAREILWLDVYLVVIYFNESDYNSEELILSNKTMGLRLYMKSSLVSKKRIKMAIERGFNKSTQGNYKKYKTRIEQMIDSFEEEIYKNDVIDLIYFPSEETRFYKNNQYLGTIQGADFKQALFGIWLSEHAVDKDLKEDLLKGI